MYTTIKMITGWLLIIAVSVPVAEQSAQAARKVLEKPEYRIDKISDDFSVQFDKASGNYLIEYFAEWVNGGTTYKVTFVPATKVDVVVEAEVDKDQRGNFIYRYRIISQKSSLQNLRGFVVEHFNAVYNLTTPINWVGNPTSFTAAISWDGYKLKSMGLEPESAQDGFGFSASPFNHAEKYTNSRPSSPGVFFRGGSLPGIVGCYASGNTGIVTFPSEPPEGVSDSIPRGLKVDAVGGKTVGPVGIPEHFDPIEFVKTIISYNRESFVQGWVEDQQTANINHEKLEKIIKTFEEGDRDLAYNLLTIFLSTIEAEKNERKLLPEAYALLKYNIEYLRVGLIRFKGPYYHRVKANDKHSNGKGKQGGDTLRRQLT